jgi:hypothetical protein
MTPDKPDLERLIEQLRALKPYIVADAIVEAAAALETLSARLEQAEGRAEHLKVCFDEAMGQVSAAQTRAERAEEIRKDAERFVRVETIVRVYFTPWGAAKAAEWEAISNDGAFDASNAMRLIRAALAGKEGKA